MSENELAKFDKMLSKVDRLIKMLLWCIGLIISGAVWASKIEMRLNDLADWKAGASADIKEHARSLENIKGRMGIAATHQPPPANESPAIVWKHQEEDGQPTQ